MKHTDVCYEEPIIYHPSGDCKTNYEASCDILVKSEMQCCQLLTLTLILSPNDQCF